MAEIDPQLSAYLESRLARYGYGSFVLTGEYSLIDVDETQPPFILQRRRHGFSKQDETMLRFSGDVETDLNGVDILTIDHLHAVHQRLSRFISGMHVHCDHDYRLPAADRHFSAVTFEHGFSMLHDEVRHIVAPGISRLTFEQQSNSPGRIISSVSASVQGLGIDLIRDPLEQIMISDFPAASLDLLGYPNYEFGLNLRAFTDGALSITNPLRYDSTVYFDNQDLLRILNIHVGWQQTHEAPAVFIDTPNFILTVGVADRPYPHSLQECLTASPEPLSFNNSFLPTLVRIQEKDMMYN